MNKKNLLLVLLLLITQFGFAQKETDANIVGDVQCNGKHIPYATIKIDGTTIIKSADATGHFHITHMPEGTYTIRVSAVGFKSTYQEVTAVSNKTVEVKFQIEEDVLNMDEVVVSADRNQTNRREAPVVVTSISPKVLEQTQSVNLAEGLNFTPGLRTEANCQNCGFTQLRMNGMEGHYTQILMNSRPVFSGLAGVYGLEIIPSNMIERLEVVKGGGSSLFGGNAIAGTVNIITKEPSRNSFSLETKYGLLGVANVDAGDPASDAHANFNGSIVSDDGKSGATMYAMLRDRSAYDANNDGFSESVMMRNTTFGLNVFYKPTIKSKISLDAYRLSEFRRGGNKLEYAPHEADIAEQVKHNITGANLALDLFTNANYDKLTIYGALQQVERDSYYGGGHDLTCYGTTKDVSGSFGAQYTINSSNFLFAPSSTIIGIEDNMGRLDDDKLGANGEPNLNITYQLTNTMGAFLQHDWKSEKVNISLGLRFDNYLVKDLRENLPDEEKIDDITGNAILPRVNVMYKITPDLRFRVGYAQGYRAPQVFDEDLHIEIAGAKRVLHVNNENLKEETSHALTASLNTDFFTGNIAHNFLVEGFYTKLVDAFNTSLDPLQGDESTKVFERTNAEDGAYVAGANFEYQTIFSPTFSTSLGLTVQKSEYETAQAWGSETSVSTHFMRTPNVYGYFTIDWNATDKLDIDLGINYTGSMYVPHFGPEFNDLNGLTGEELSEAKKGNDDMQAAIDKGFVIEGERLEESDSFISLDLLCRYNLKLANSMTLEFSAGVKNILNQVQNDFDKGEYRDAGYIYGPIQARSINFGIKIGNIF